MEKFIENGMVAVLISHGYGAGWSTWDSHGIDIALDKRIVEYFLNSCGVKNLSEYLASEEDYEDVLNTIDNDSIEKFLESIGYDNVYVGGFSGLCIELVPVGSAIQINEYDGSESLTVGYDEFTVV